MRTVSVFVNDTLQPQFRGRVLLDEGRNTVRVSVAYIEETGKSFAVYQDYTVYVDLGHIILQTDLQDQTITEQTITLSLIHIFV